uniref:Catalase KatE n=1 Tax=uncultured Armatimonadetes bacterium TaxID=157466 RepID=A0A6J4H2K5_9BACT|nr:Catalase KatE [uncultured Armatimonadetes bacterium]
MGSAARALGPGEERPPAGEAEDIARIEGMLRREFGRTNPPGSPGPARRDQHPKAHGCVAAEFVVRSDLPPELRRGLFRQPGAAYPAWVRFSSSSPKMHPDTERDAHGMAIKILGAPGEAEEVTQDFVLANSKVFFVRTTADYVRFMEAFMEGRLPRFFFPSANPFRWRLRELINMRVATGKAVANPLEIQYWSQTPSLFGGGAAAKFSARPAGSAPPPQRIPRGAGPDFLREAMARTLSAGAGVRFDFLVQLQTDPAAMPVEDATVPWDEDRSPYRAVATLWIPAQQFDTPERDALAEHLSFTPWHGLPEHRPLGNTNRVRRRAYDLISLLRHERNGRERTEPAAAATFPHELFQDQPPAVGPGEAGGSPRDEGGKNPDEEPEPSSMTLLHRVLPGREETLRALLRVIGNDIRGARDNTYIRFKEFERIHFARWVLLPPPEDAPRAAWQLAFGTDHDGTDAELVRELAAKAGGALDAIYSHCDGWPGARNIDPAVRYLLSGRLPYAARHVACRRRSVAALRQALENREAMQRFVDDTLQPKIVAAEQPPPDGAAAREVVARIAAGTGATLPPRPAPLNWQLPALGLLVLGGGAWGLSRLSRAGRVGALAGVAGAAGAYLLALRAREEGDAREWVPAEPPEREHLAELRAWEDRIVQNQMTHLVDVKPGAFRRATLRGVFAAIDFLARFHWNRGDLGGIPTIHFARWVLIDGGRRLLFFSNYDGSWENYLGDFIDRASVGLTGVWSNTVGFPPARFLVGDGSRRAEAFKNWTRQNQIETQVWYSAYPDVSVVNLLDALALCEGREVAEAPPGRASVAWLQRL